MPVGSSGELALTPEAIADVRSRIGDEHPAKAWWTVVTPETIKHFAEGYGDMNPMYLDPAYGSGTRWGTQLAPPTFLYSVISAGGSTGGVGLPGAFSLHGEDEWEWFKPVTVGMHLRGTQRLISVEEKPSEWSGLTIHQVVQTDFFSENDELIAQYRMKNVRGERKNARSSKKYDPEQEAGTWYTDDELNAIAAAYEAEEIRGSVPRYWEDVSVGDSLGHVVKGPLTVRDIICWWMGRGAPLLKAFHHWHAYMKKRPGIALIDPETNLRDTPEAAHYDDRLARRSGVAGPYDIGQWRTAWIQHLLTNWGGDDAMLRKLTVKLLKPNYTGSTTWVRGEIAAKDVLDGWHVVACSIQLRNQKDELHTTATATIELPSRAAAWRP